MTRALFAIMAAACLAASTGCCTMDRLFSGGCGPTWNEGCGGGCDSCGGGGCDSCGGGHMGGHMGGCDTCGHGGHGGRLGHGKLLGHHGCRGCGNDGNGYADVGPAGPPTGAVTYPYYTNRGPRDFLVNNPPSIGP